jgi:hypothetical protein
MRIAIAAVLFAAFSIQVNAQSSSPVVDREWYTGVKRSAKYARIAITHTADLQRMNEELVAARGYVVAADRLSLPEAGRNTCRAAAQAVVDAIRGAQAGNMDTGPASYASQFRRWEMAGAQCLAAINGR